MILSSIVKVKVHNRNKEHYNKLGYTPENNMFSVKVEHLLPSSAAYIEIQCDYCFKLKTIKVADHTKTISEFIKKDACIECTHHKREEILHYRIENNLMSENEIRGIYKNKPFVLKSLKSFIETNNYVGNVENDIYWRRIVRGIKNVGMTMESACKEIGYNLSELQLRMPNGYYDDFETVKNSIQVFIDKNGRFPSQNDLSNEIGIFANSYLKHGTIAELKEKMGYSDENDLVDLSGYINKSRYELITANFLIMNGVPYKREQFPFKEFDKTLNYKSDFCFYLPNGEKIHCEVWGGMRPQTSVTTGKYENYNDIMEKKISLYNKYNIQLISIDPNIFNYSIKGIKNNLKKIFAPYLKLNFNKVDNSLLSTATLKNLTDQDLLNNIMEFSDDGEHLPTSSHLRKLGHEYLFIEALKRYDHYIDFANKFNLKTKRKNNNYWTLELIYEKFDYMIDRYEKLLSSEELKKINNTDYVIRNLYDRIVSFGGYTTVKMLYMKDKIENNQPYISSLDPLPHQVIDNKLNSPIKPEQLELANNILQLLSQGSNKS